MHADVEAFAVFRSLLAAIKPAPFREMVLEFSVSLAQQHQLLLDACAVVDTDRLAPAEPVPMGAGAFKSHLDEQVIAEARQNAAAAMSRVSDVSRQRGVDCRTHVEDGDTAAILVAAVQRCDLLVCGHTRGGDASERSLLHAILKHCPRPAIVTPQQECSVRNVLVAYDGSVQAARTLASFVASGFGKGCAVHVVAFDDGPGKSQQQAETAQAFLLRHGMASETHAGLPADDVGSQILTQAEHLSADLVVMGAFGRSAVREFFFGSVTQSVLSALPVPIFVDH